MYPWNRPATPEEIAEGDALFEAGWRGISQRYRTVALLEQKAFKEWLAKEGHFSRLIRENPEDSGVLRSIQDQYLRCAAPSKSIAFHAFRQVKRRENNWDPGVLKMIQKVFDPKTTKEELCQMFPGSKNVSKNPD
tara:strand:+ start:68 stop:472 length:405 start_codon:yes stop_codon:yes gene_type:complete